MLPFAQLFPVPVAKFFLSAVYSSLFRQLSARIQARVDAPEPTDAENDELSALCTEAAVLLREAHDAGWWTSGVASDLDTASTMWLTWWEDSEKLELSRWVARL